MARAGLRSGSVALTMWLETAMRMGTAGMMDWLVLPYSYVFVPELLLPLPLRASVRL